MRDGYRRAARRCRVLSERIDIPTPYVLVDEKEIETLFTDDVFDGWDSFYKKYSDSTGFISLSNVGFAPDLKRAVLYISRECGGKCGTGDFVLLEKDGALWKVHRTVNVWVS
ncbi:MAG: hypothetical protein JSS81_03665 [Acidobacteria bacterium]|nr:hypothetical protein [Acidobacteriota bacterium]